MDSQFDGTPVKNARSLATRERILTQARQVFAELGFENTTIRAVASQAKIHPSMVMRYFRSKEELFAASTSIDFRMPDLAKVAPECRGQALVAHLMDQWEGESTRRELQRVVTRSRTVLTTRGAVGIVRNVSGQTSVKGASED